MRLKYVMEARLSVGNQDIHMEIDGWKRRSNARILIIRRDCETVLCDVDR